MKKILIGLLVAIVLVVALVMIGGWFYLDGAIKKGVETVGPMVTKVDVKLDSVNLSLLSGSGSIKGLVVGNPAGYKTARAIGVGKSSISLEPRSLFSDKVVVRSIRVESPEIFFELGPGGSNLQQIQRNVRDFAGSKPAAEPKEPKTAGKAAKKIQVDEVVITGGKVTLGAAALGGTLVEQPLPEIRLPALGQGPEGITTAELTELVLTAITEKAIEVGAEGLTEMGKQALDSAAKRATEGLSNKAQSVISDLLKKKK